MKGYNPKAALGRWKAAEKRTYEERRHWVNYLVPSLARAICQEKGWDGYQYGHPCGLCCRVGIRFFKNGKEVWWLEVSDPDLETGTLRVTDYTKDNGEFRSGTIGYMNGMNHPSFVIDPAWSAGRVLQYGCLCTADVRKRPVSGKIFPAMSRVK